MVGYYIKHQVFGNVRGEGKKKREQKGIKGKRREMKMGDTVSRKEIHELLEVRYAKNPNV